MKFIGGKLEDKEYEERRTSYGLIFNEKGEIAVAYIKKYNMYNLIGGRIEGKETSKQALIRETQEEIGYSLKDIEYIDNLGCYYYFDIMDKYELGIMDFYKAKLDARICNPIEEDHQLTWVKPEEIVDKMYFEYHRYIINKYIKQLKELDQYKNNNLKIYYKLQDKKIIADIEKAAIEGYNKAIEYFDIHNYTKEIIIYVYNSIEELHLDVFGVKKEEWEVSCGDDNLVKVVTPANSGKVHDYNTILEVISKSVADIILHDNFKNIPKWLDITTYITGLNTETNTYSKPSIIRLKRDNYFNYSDCYFITRYIVETFGKDTIIKILKNPSKYNEILKLSDEQIDKKLKEYYG